LSYSFLVIIQIETQYNGQPISRQRLRKADAKVQTFYRIAKFVLTIFTKKNESYLRTESVNKDLLDRRNQTS